MALLLTLIAGWIIWIVLWAIGGSGFDGFLVFLLVLAIAAFGRVMAPFLPGNRPDRD